MFPPAELPLDEALAVNEAARHSEPGWIVNRFVVRASDFDRLPPDDPPRLSVVLDVPWSHDALALDDPRVEAIELGPTQSFSLATRQGEPQLEVYYERPPGSKLAPLAEIGVRAKVRCGGAHVPTGPELAAFVAECRRLQLPFKATAGLHHAVRSDGEHGFLNVLAAAVFGDEEAALDERDAGAFALDAESFRWRDRAATPEEIAAIRRDLFVSIGSCSFDEPVEELRALGFL